MKKKKKVRTTIGEMVQQRNVWTRKCVTTAEPNLRGKGSYNRQREKRMWQ